MSIGQLGSIQLRRIYFRELYFSFRRNTDELDSSSQCKFLKSGSETIVDDGCIGVESCPCDSRIKFASALLHGANDVNDRSHFGELELVQHVPKGQIFLVNIVDFDELSQLSTRKQKVVRLPKVLLRVRLLHGHYRVLHSLLSSFLLGTQLQLFRPFHWTFFFQFVGTFLLGVQ